VSQSGPWPYCLHDPYYPGTCYANGIQSAQSVFACGSGSGVSPTPSYPSHDPNAQDSYWDTTYTANYTVVPGYQNLTCSFVVGTIIEPATVQNAIQVFDASPVILGLQATAPDPNNGQFYLQLYGTNLGAWHPSHGTVSVCNERTSSCNDFTLTLDAAQFFVWSPLQVNVLLTPTASASASDTYDVQITSNGASGLGFAQLTGQSQPQSNKAQFLGQNPTVTITGPMGVPVGASDTFSVSVTQPQPSNPVPVTLSLSTTQGSGSAQFSDGTTSMSITSSQSVSVKGVSASSAANKIQLVAKPKSGTGILAQIKLSSVSVTISMLNQGPFLSERKRVFLFPGRRPQPRTGDRKTEQSVPAGCPAYGSDHALRLYGDRGTTKKQDGRTIPDGPDCDERLPSVQ